MSYDNSRLIVDRRRMGSGHFELPLVTCGSCRFVTRIASDAVAHVQETGHDMYCNGSRQDFSKHLTVAVPQQRKAG